MKQLLYTSAATHPFTPEEFQTLLRKARTHNSAYGLSGVLLHHTGSFLHALEGNALYLDKTFASIQRDPRHASLKILSEKSIDRREFGNLALCFTDTALSNRQPTGLLDLFQLQPLLTLKLRPARKYLDFFRQRFCPDLPPVHQSYLHHI